MLAFVLFAFTQILHKTIYYSILLHVLITYLQGQLVLSWYEVAFRVREAILHLVLT